MRLKVTLDGKDRKVPYEYHGFLQGAIYNAMSENFGDFFHNEGFKAEGRTYKMFVFSDLQGKYTPSKEGLTFLGEVVFYISSISSNLLNQLYVSFNEAGSIILGKEEFPIVRLEPVDDIHYHEDHIYTLRTLSPILAYKTDAKHYSTYFNPKSADFEECLQNNLRRKYSTIYDEEPVDQFFEIIEITRMKETKVKFKKAVYPSSILTFKARVSNQYLSLLMHAGLGSKNAAGFGMVEIL